MRAEGCHGRQQGGDTRQIKGIGGKHGPLSVCFECVASCPWQRRLMWTHGPGVDFEEVMKCEREAGGGERGSAYRVLDEHRLPCA